MGVKAYKTPQAGWYDLPLIGDDITKIGRVIDLWSDPCKPTMEVWVYGMFQAIPTLFVTLSKPEIWDINIRHKRGKPRKGKRYKFFADYVFRDAYVNIPVPRWVVFRLYEVTQRIGWYFLVADALEDFGINWLSMAYRGAGCQLPQLTYGSRAVINGLGGGVHANTPARWVNPLVGASNMIAVNNQLVITEIGEYRVNFSCDFRPFEIESESEIPYTMFCQVGDGDIQMVGEFANKDGGRYTTGSFNISVDYPAGVSVGLYAVQLQEAKFYRVTSTLDVDKVTNNELEPDP